MALLRKVVAFFSIIINREELKYWNSSCRLKDIHNTYTIMKQGTKAIYKHYELFVKDIRRVHIKQQPLTHKVEVETIVCVGIVFEDKNKCQ